MPSLNLYINTLRHLRPIQISSRLRLLSRRKLFQRSENSRAARYAPTMDAPYQRLDIHAPAYAPVDEHDFDNNTFVFLNDAQGLGDPINWFPAEATQLWKYNLHYFDFSVLLANDHLAAEDQAAYSTFRRLAESWMDACPLATPLAWDPYPISLRTSNWLKAYSWFAAEIDQDRAFAVRLRQSIWTQVRFLEDNLEYHLLGNHLIENGRALLLAGLFFQDDAGERWRRKGMQILVDELDEQFLADGGHYERSPMYHQIMLHLYTDVLDALTGRGIAAPASMVEGVEKMQHWLQAMLHPDGDIALFNDAAFKIAPPVGHQFESRAVEDGFHALADSGYFVFKDIKAGDTLIFDCGPLGPDYQPGHGHSDTLSYELSLDGQRIIVDSGVGNYYGDEEWRHYYRRTCAHNTIVVDDVEQSEVWGRFRVAHRAYPRDVFYQGESDGLAYAVGSHTGYRRLPGKPEHRRWVAWIDRRFWVICDQIRGDGEHKMESLIHLHPEASIRQLPAGDDGFMRSIVERGTTTLQILPWGAMGTAHIYGQVEPIQGWYAPEFGIAHPNHVWALQHSGPLPHSMGYILWPGEEEVEISVDAVGVPGAGRHQLTVATGETTYRIICTYREVKMEKLL